MADDLLSLIGAARKVANVHTDVDLARFLGISRRTVLRHHHQGGIPSGADFDKLIAAVRPIDPDLARRLARVLGRDLMQPPVEKPAPPPSKPEATAEQAAMVLVTASDALGMLPRDVRPALKAILEKIEDLGVDHDQLIALLAEPPEAKKA